MADSKMTKGPESERTASDIVKDNKPVFHPGESGFKGNYKSVASNCGSVYGNFPVNAEEGAKDEAYNRIRKSGRAGKKGGY